MDTRWGPVGASGGQVGVRWGPVGSSGGPAPAGCWEMEMSEHKVAQLPRAIPAPWAEAGPNAAAVSALKSTMPPRPAPCGVSGYPWNPVGVGWAPVGGQWDPVRPSSGLLLGNGNVGT